MDLASLRSRGAATLCLLFVVGCSSGSATPTTPVEIRPTIAPTRAPALALHPGATPQSVTQAQSLPPVEATAATVRMTSLAVGPTDTLVTVEAIGGHSPLDLGGWVFRVGEQSAVVPTGSLIPQAAHLTLHAASGVTTSRDVYVGLDTAAVADLLKPGVRVVLEDRSGAAISETNVASR